MDEMSFYAKEEHATEDSYLANIYHVIVDEADGPTVSHIATFYEQEEADAFLRAWNGEATPGARPADIGLD